VLQADCEVVPKKPIIGNFRDCCARAARGQAAAAPPSSVMNSRRFTQFDERPQNTNVHWGISDEPMSADEWKKRYVTPH
jgi:hypothetical protein